MKEVKHAGHGSNIRERNKSTNLTATDSSDTVLPNIVECQCVFGRAFHVTFKIIVYLVLRYYIARI